MAVAKPVTACVLIIGNEILSGRTQDKNLAYLAKLLNEQGVQVTESRIIPDDTDVIVSTLNHCRQAFDYVITTGGIGPTHDDITTDCVAQAFGVDLHTDPEIEAMIRKRPAANEEQMAARMRMARLPEGSKLVRNEYGPPGYKIDNVFVLAGIPNVMQSMAQSLIPMLSGGEAVKSRSIEAHLTESEIASPLGAIQNAHPEVSIGSYPFFKDGIYGTSLVVRSADEQLLEKVFEQVKELVHSLSTKSA